MKKVMFFVICVFLFSACNKDEDPINEKTFHEIAKSYYFQVTFAAGSSSEVQCYEIAPFYSEDNAILLYINSSSNSVDNDLYWSQLPYTTSTNDLYYYEIGDSGILYLGRKADEGSSWNTSGTYFYKAVIIPNSIYAKNLKKGIDHSNYEIVKKVYNIKD